MRCKPLTVLVLPLLAIGSAVAAPLHWDGNDTDPSRADGGVGIWNTLLTNWDTAAAGGVDSAWTNAIPPVAVFGGTAGTVTLGEPATVAGIQFNTTGYAIAAGTNRLSFASAQTPILLGTITAATITGSVGGAGGVHLANNNPSAARTLTLNGTSTNGWTGATTVNPVMTLAMDGPNQALVNTSAIAIKGGTLSYNNVLAAQVGLNFINDTAPITFTGGGTLTWRPVNAGPSYTETVGPVTVENGQASFNTGTLSSGSATLILPGPVTRNQETVALVFSIANGGVPTNTNRIRLNGAGTTAGWASGATSNPVIGPWATTGYSTGSPDYAVCNGDFVVASATAASPEDTWTNATRVVHNNVAAVALTGPRAVAGLRNSAATATLTLSDGVSGQTLATDGLLNAANTVFTVAPGAVPGALTANGSAGGRVFVTSAAGPITISAPLVDNGGPVTLVKSGANTVTLSSTNSTYSGGTVINAGTVGISNNANLGAAGTPVTFDGSATLQSTVGTTQVNLGTRPVFLNGGAVASFTGPSGRANLAVGGKVTGSGGVMQVNSTFWGKLALTSTENDFTGPIISAQTGTDYGSGNPNTSFTLNSIADVPGAGNILLVGGADCGIEYGAGAVTNLVLNHRQIVVVNNNGVTFGNASAQAVTINTDLGFGGTGARAIKLGYSAAGRSGAGVNTFAGRLTDNTGGALTVTVNGGAWSLSGANSFSGGLTLNGGSVSARLNFNSPTAIGTGTFTVSGGNNARLGNTSGALIVNTNNNPQVWNNDFAFVGPNDLDLGNGAVSLGGNRILNVATNTVLSVGGVIGEPAAARGLNKQGTGTLVLRGANSYTGATTVTAGKLLVHGDQSAASGAVTVAANATLGGRGTLGGNVTVANNGRLEFSLTTPAGGHDRLELAAGRTFTFSGASALTILSSGGAAPGRYTLVTAPGGFTGSAPASVNLPANWVATASIDGNDLVLDVTSTGTPGGYSDWQSANGTTQAVNGDHDGDGVTNGIEWFVHGPNASATADAAPGVFSSLGGITVTWTKHPDFGGAYGVDYVVESADAPQGPWNPEVLGGQVAIVGQEVRFTFATPLPNRKYAQLKVISP